MKKGVTMMNKENPMTLEIQTSYRGISAYSQATARGKYVHTKLVKTIDRYFRYAQRNEVLEGSVDATVEEIRNLIEYVDEETRRFGAVNTLYDQAVHLNYDPNGISSKIYHSCNVAIDSLIIADALGINDEQFKIALALGALTHDIGQIKCRDIVEKKGNLNDEELERMRGHPGDTYLIMLRPIKESSLSTYQKMIATRGPLHHHENYGGKGGYPNGLEGEEISQEGRIIQGGDIKDAALNREYKMSFAPGRKTINQFKDELLLYSGTRYDPEIVKVLTQGHKPKAIGEEEN